MCLTQKTLSQRSSSTRFILMVSHATAGPTVHHVQAAWLACDHPPSSPPATLAFADTAEASLGDLDRFISMLRKQVWQLCACVDYTETLQQSCMQKVLNVSKALGCILSKLSWCVVVVLLTQIKTADKEIFAAVRSQSNTQARSRLVFYFPAHTQSPVPSVMVAAPAAAVHRSFSWLPCQQNSSRPKQQAWCSRVSTATSSTCASSAVTTGTCGGL